MWRKRWKGKRLGNLLRNYGVVSSSWWTKGFYKEEA
jgi:hypothetical protein